MIMRQGQLIRSLDERNCVAMVFASEFTVEIATLNSNLALAAY